MAYSDFFAGNVTKENAFEIKDMLEVEKDNGNRFVSFPLNSNSLYREDVFVFNTAFDAMEHAYDNSTDIDKYSTSSITSAAKAIDNVLLGYGKENSRKQNNKPQLQIEPEKDRLRDNGLTL